MLVYSIEVSTRRTTAAPDAWVRVTDVIHTVARECDSEVVILYIELTNLRESVRSSLPLPIRACDLA